MQTTHIEQDVIVLCLKDSNFLMDVYVKLSPNHFTKHPFKWIYWATKEHFRKYGKCPEKSILLNELAKSRKVKDKTKILYRKMIEELFDKKPALATYTKDEVDKYIENTNFVRCLDAASEYVEKGEMGKARSLVENELLSFSNNRGYKIVSWLEEFHGRQTERKRRKDNPKNYIMARPPYKCLYPFIDGIQGGEIASVTALTSVGKSIMLHDWGAFNMIEGLNVLHVPLEGTEWQASQRYDSRILGIPYDAFKRYTFTKKQSKQIERNIAAIKKYIGDTLKIVKGPQQGFTITMLEQIMRDLEIKGSYTQFLILDYADLMSPHTKYESFRLKQSGVYWDIKYFAEMRNLSLLTATQAPQEYGRPDKRGRLPRMGAESAGESYWKPRILDIMLTLYQTIKQKFMSQVTLHIAKNRDGPRGAEFVLREDFSNMRFIEVT